MAPLKVLISGGGITGNALAFWLSKQATMSQSSNDSLSYGTQDYKLTCADTGLRS